MSEIVSSRTPDADYLITGAYIRYSSEIAHLPGWTARIITLLEYFSIPYRFHQHSKSNAEGFKAIKSTPAGWVPILTVSSLSNTIIHDSLSIAEFLSESHPTLPLWPRNRRLRALARSVVAELHSGFAGLRYTYHTNFVAHYTGTVPISPEVYKEVVRLLAIFEFARQQTRSEGVEGGYLFGEFGIADAFFWPILWRFRTYAVDLSTATPLAREWICLMWADPKLRALGKTAFAESRDPATGVPEYDNLWPGQAEMVKYDEDAVYEPKF
ncbi:hypothetical protein Q9L58_006333 [Maublancomyces gigas]|uniref:Glutathione S-transferase n=1 Tax=Discina gigas TaxID=1032678 RepID=A0ABR3GG56_9PEZI